MPDNEPKPIRPDQAGGQTGQPNFGEREYETLGDEFMKAHSETSATSESSQAYNLYNNMKRTYDEYQHESLDTIRANRRYVDKVLSDAQQHDNQRQTIANQALQNAVETANMVSKNAIRHTEQLANQHTAHRDMATDSGWSHVEEGAENVLTARAVTIDDASLKAIGATVAVAVAEALKKGIS